MKRIQMIICLLSFFLFTKGQNTTGYTDTRNYIAEKTYLDASSKTGNSVRSVDDITYSDGFGRKWQEIQVLGSPVGSSDLIIPLEYGIFGQIEKEYLPYVKEGNNGAFDVNMLVPSHWNIYGTEEQNYAFTHTQYEDSPLLRVVQKTGPGKAWHTNDKSTSTLYGMNQGNEVRMYKVSSGGALLLDGYYLASTLQKTTVTDEDGYKTETFTDNEDKIVLSAMIDGNERLETYYVYDDRNQLRFVLPPEASSQLKTTDMNVSVLEKLAYYYEYDQLDRMIVKRLPGCAPIYLVYDWQNRLVLSQNGNQRAVNNMKWSYFVYDDQDREVESGEIVTSASLTHQQLQQNAWDKNEYLPEGAKTPLKYTAYDGYGTTGQVTTDSFVAFAGYKDGYSDNLTGLATGTKVKVLGTDSWVITTIYYDEWCRPIQKVLNRPGKGLSYINTVYDFLGNALKQQEIVGVDTLETSYTYDDRGRLLTKEYKWNGKASDKVSYKYDAVGRMITKQYGERTKESFLYNIRDWVTSIDSPHFSQTLHYVDGVGSPCYNGNISSMTWRSGSETGLRGYKFTYDGFSRLKVAIYGEGERFSNNLNRFNEQVTGYDKNGNILGLLRYGQINTTGYGLVDNLNMFYDGNQLHAVNDNATNTVFGNGMEFKNGASTAIEYEYDANGNLTKDLNKKIAAIQYNCLNLPEKIQFADGNLISYLYAADGTKLSTTHVIGSNTTVTDYYGNAIYENGVLTKVLTEDGYITASNNLFHYYIQDHQGNNRVVVSQNGTVEEVNDYYPFGGLLSTSLSNSVQPYKYNGKELDRKNGLDWYDYGARMYDAAIGRWHVVDPMSEKYYNWSPYMYCIGNPNNTIDLQGKLVIFVNGFHTGSGGTSAYWEGFDNRVSNFLNDNNRMYIDGSLGGYNTLKNNTRIMNADYRRDNGYTRGMMEASNIVQLISDDNGNIKETVKILTHSMGASYAKGYVQALKEYFINNNIPLSNIAFEMDFAPFQPTKQSAVEGIDTYQVTNLYDDVANSRLLGSPFGYIKGAKVYLNDDMKKGHSIIDFLDDIWRLPNGNYRVDINGNIIRTE